jgi:hypothetical protein
VQALPLGLAPLQFFYLIRLRRSHGSAGVAIRDSINVTGSRVYDGKTVTQSHSRKVH